MKYRPSTLDDFDVLRRMRDAQRRDIANQTAPTGSNVYATTEKLQELDIGTLPDRVSDLEDEMLTKQDALTAGANVQIAGTIISATDTTYSAGTNVQISASNVISATDTTYTAGANVQISAQNEISATDTTYNDATQSTHGLMSTADKTKLDNLAYLPVGSMVIMRMNTAPALYGTWTLVTGFHLHMTNVSSTTFYLYERTA